MIQDIKPVEKPRKQIKAHPEKMLQVDVNYLEHVDSHLLMAELYARNISVRHVFGFYYQLEEMVNGRTMTVEDAILAGYGNNFNPMEGF